MILRARLPWLCLLLLLFAGPGSGQSIALDRIVALVDEDIVLQSELDRAVGNVKRQYAGRENQLPPEGVLRKQVLERLVLNRLQLQRAEMANIKVTQTEIDQAIGRIAAGNEMSVADLKRAVEGDGLDFGDFRVNVTEELILQRLRDRMVASRVDVSETEVDLALAHDQVQAGEVRLGTILVALPQNADQGMLDRARQKIGGIRDLVVGGEMEFSAAAIRYSDAPQAIETGGDIGWRRFDQLPPSFAEAVAVMKEGEISPPLRGPSGYHLLKVLGRREAQNIVITEYSARHIVVDVTELTDEAEALSEIQRLRRQVVEGGDFAKLAKEFSDDSQSANLGGDMGWFQLQAFGSVYAETIARLGEGEISEPVRTERGWHLIQLLKTRQQDRTTEVLRAQAREAIRNRKMEEAYEAFLRQIRSEAFVELRLESAG